MEAFTKGVSISGILPGLLLVPVNQDLMYSMGIDLSALKLARGATAEFSDEEDGLSYYVTAAMGTPFVAQGHVQRQVLKYAMGLRQIRSGSSESVLLQTAAAHVRMGGGVSGGGASGSESGNESENEQLSVAAQEEDARARSAEHSHCN
jgi:hypothetical protein